MRPEQVSEWIDAILQGHSEAHIMPYRLGQYAPKTRLRGIGADSQHCSCRLPPGHEPIGDPTVTDGIPDQLVHNAHRIAAGRFDGVNAKSDVQSTVGMTGDFRPLSHRIDAACTSSGDRATAGDTVWLNLHGTGILVPTS